MAEKNTLRLLILKSELCNGRVTQWYEASLCAGGSWSAGSNPGGLLAFFFVFFSFHRIFTLWLVAVYPHCRPFLASRDFFDNVFRIEY